MDYLHTHVTQAGKQIIKPKGCPVEVKNGMFAKRTPGVAGLKTQKRNVLQGLGEIVIDWCCAPCWLMSISLTTIFIPFQLQIFHQVLAHLCSSSCTET